jgi:hypothetical protein
MEVVVSYPLIVAKFFGGLRHRVQEEGPGTEAVGNSGGLRLNDGTIGCAVAQTGRRDPEAGELEGVMGKLRVNQGYIKSKF